MSKDYLQRRAEIMPGAPLFQHAVIVEKRGQIYTVAYTPYNHYQIAYVCTRHGDSIKNACVHMARPINKTDPDAATPGACYGKFYAQLPGSTWRVPVMLYKY